MDRYQNYQEMVSTVTSSIAKLDGVCDKLKMKNQKNELNAASRRLNEHVSLWALWANSAAEKVL